MPFLIVVEFIVHHVAVMYLEKIVEMAPAQSIYQHPCHSLYQGPALCSLPQ